MSAVKLIVEVKGGMVQAVYADCEPRIELDIVVLDRDVEIDSERQLEHDRLDELIENYKEVY